MGDSQPTGFAAFVPGILRRAYRKVRPLRESEPPSRRPRRLAPQRAAARCNGAGASAQLLSPDGMLRRASLPTPPLR